MSQESDENYFDDEDDDDDYYNHDNDFMNSDEDNDQDGYIEDGSNMSSNVVKKRIQELMSFDYECLTPLQVADRLNKDAETASNYLSLSMSQSCLVLQANKWKMAAVIAKASTPSGKSKLLIESRVLQELSNHKSENNLDPHIDSNTVCQVCFENFKTSDLASLSCKHLFCHKCWKRYIKVSVLDGLSSEIPCMESSCTLLCPEDFVRLFLSCKPRPRGKTIAELYAKYLFQNSVDAHYQLRFCSGVNCDAIFFADSPKPRRVHCSKCKFSCCFDCGNPYHIPTDCNTIKKWLLKCADDSETANYISANTKDCPNCHACIEKNGGCNHMRCSKCNHDFCWMCLNDWKRHGDSYYDCTRYKENQGSPGNECTKARDALKKYLFYFHRWEIHSQSLRLESEARSKIQKQIEEKVNKNEGTWIDWQYLLRAGELLAQCRSILHHTYPWAYYAEPGPEKLLFEHQQAQLELEIEGLAWKLENAGDYQRGQIENQMDVCEKRTHTLVARFVED